MRRRWVYLAACVLGAGLCWGAFEWSEMCQLTESRCDQNKVMSCGRETGFLSLRTFDLLSKDCDDAICVDVDNAEQRRAVCSSSERPDPRCDTTTGEWCVGETTLLACWYGYGHEQPCAGRCVDHHPLSGIAAAGCVQARP